MLEQEIKIEHIKEAIEFPDYIIRKNNLFELYKQFNN